jgi:taurine dioxygenase
MAVCEILPFDAALGAQVRCGDVRTASDAAMAQLRHASLDHLVLLIRNQTLSDAELSAFGQRFGELQLSNPLPSPLANEGRAVQGGRNERHPEVTVVSNVVESGVALGGLGDGELVWHSDMSSFAAPPNQTILHALEVPASGGRTGFVNLYRAYETLPAVLKSRVRDLQLKHDATIDAAGYVRKQFAKGADLDLRAAPGSVHPLVRTHPETRRDCLYLGRRARAHVVGMAQAASEALLDALWAHATQAQFIWRHDWRAGDVLIWDNRCTMHHREPFDSTARRHLHRVVVKGSVPVLAAVV